jgi:hypothetical protein
MACSQRATDCADESAVGPTDRAHGAETSRVLYIATLLDLAVPYRLTQSVLSVDDENILMGQCASNFVKKTPIKSSTTLASFHWMIVVKHVIRQC